MGLITSSRNFWSGLSSREKEIHCYTTRGCWTAPQDLISAGHPAAFPEAWERPVLGQEVLLSSLTGWSGCHWSGLISCTYPSLQLEARFLGLKGSLFILGPVFHLASCQKSGLQASAGLGRWPGSPPICFPPFCVVINSFQPVVLDQFISAGAASAAGMMYGPQRRARLPMNHRSCSVSAPERAIRIRCNQLREGGVTYGCLFNNSLLLQLSGAGGAVRGAYPRLEGLLINQKDKIINQGWRPRGR